MDSKHSKKPRPNHENKRWIDRRIKKSWEEAFDKLLDIVYYPSLVSPPLEPDSKQHESKWTMEDEQIEL